MASILASATTANQSSDFTVVAGTPNRLLLWDAAGPVLHPLARVMVQAKASNNQYFTVGELTAAAPMMILIGPGLYRVDRPAQTTAVGVDKD